MLTKDYQCFKVILIINKTNNSIISFLSIEEQENYELSKSLQQATPLKSANMTILPSPSPLASTSSLPLMGSCVIGSNGSTKAVHQQDQQQEQQRPTPHNCLT